MKKRESVSLKTEICVVCLFVFFRIKQGEHVVVEKRKEGQTWKGDLL